MDPRLTDCLPLTDGVRFQAVVNYALPLYTNHDFGNDLGNGLLGNRHINDNNGNNNFGEVNFIPFDPITSDLPSTYSLRNTHVENFHEDYEFSDTTLGYINQILVEEDVEGKGCMLQESLEHQTVEDSAKSLYHIVEKEYPYEHDDLGSGLHELNPNPLLYMPSNFENLEHDLNYRSVIDTEGCSGLLGDPGWAYDLPAMGTLPLHDDSISLYKSIGNENLGDGLMGPPVRNFSGLDQYDEIESISHISKAFPSESELSVTLDANVACNGSKELGKAEIPCDKEDGSGCQSRKHSFGENMEVVREESSNKQAATCDDFEVRSDMFDKVLLYHARDQNELIASLRSTLQTTASKKMEQNGQSKGLSATKGRGKKNNAKKEVIDLRTLLSNCAEAVAMDDRKNANDLLKRIRQNSSSSGDGTQRLAHYVADGLEARLAGLGSEIYKNLTTAKTSAGDVLKAYLLYLATCPFRKVSNFFSNKNIAKRTLRVSKIHIIDFGILYGFQWPSFIQRQSVREGGPPKIKITGIDFPQPGFRPAERVEETGLRLENYAEEFKVPFEYRAIAKRWDAIKVEDFDIEEDEMVIVSCMFRMKNLPDETMSMESSRNNVLKLIRKLNPKLFIHGVVNGSYNAPFFVTRFREALFYFSAQFDMLDTIVPRDYGERVLIERDLLAREALNVIACEGWERVERPETYKQWQARTMRAGFRQTPLDLEIKERSTMQVRNSYHKDFVIDEDHRWLLLGWKGRILFALTTWKPT